MKSTIYGIMIIFIVKSSYQMAIEDLEDILVYPIDAPKRIEKRDTSMQKKVLNNFIEDKLIEHSQALEHLLRIVENNEDLIKQLVKNFTTTVDKPKLPEKIEVPKPTRRNNGDEEMVDNNNIIFRYGKKIPIYGTLFKNVILKNFDDRTDPMPLVEKI